MTDNMIIINPIGVNKSGTENNITYYQIIGESNGNTYFMTFAVKSCYEEATDKAFKRLNPISIQEDKDEEKDNSNIDDTTSNCTDTSSKCKE